MSSNRIATSAAALAVQAALTNAWLREQGVPEMRETWIARHYGSDDAPA